MSAAERRASRSAGVDISDVKGLDPIAQKLGAMVARKMFESRGNHSEIHLSERELALVAATAAQTAITHGRRLAGMET